MDEELEEIKKRKMEQIKKQQESQEQQHEAEEQMRAQKKALLRKVMTADARERLGNIRVARPELAERIESQIISLAQRGATKGKIDDDTLKELLKKLKGNKKEINIKRR
ncbi:MAG: DNA-binding protein [Thermoplasmatota archaeon]